MASMNISITKEAYDFLRMLKGRDKSFSDVVLEFKGNDLGVRGTGKGILKYSGFLKDADIDWEGVNKNIKDFRDEFDERVEKRVHDRY